jgi:fluoride exporter
MPARSRTSPRPDVLAAISVGGALGTLARYEVAQLIHVTKDTFPWPTFVTNLSGAFAIGVVLTVILERFRPTRLARPFFVVGFLGGFTTFSTMAVETVLLVKDGDPLLGVGYLLISVIAGLACCYGGIVVARRA